MPRIFDEIEILRYISRSLVVTMVLVVMFVGISGSSLSNRPNILGLCIAILISCAIMRSTVKHMALSARNAVKGSSPISKS